MSNKTTTTKTATVNNSTAPKKSRAYFKDVKNLSEVRATFIDTALKLKDPKSSKAFISQYIKAYNDLRDVQPVYGSDKTFKKSALNSAEAFAGMVLALKKLDGVTLRMEGRLLVAEGDTKPNRQIFKKYGFVWKPQVEKWYWNDVETRGWRAVEIPTA